MSKDETPIINASAYMRGQRHGRNHQAPLEQQCEDYYRGYGIGYEQAEVADYLSREQERRIH